MEHSLGNPFREDHKIRKPGVAGLVGDVFGPVAQKALERKIGKDKLARPIPQEDWEGVDIRMSAAEKAEMKAQKEWVKLRLVPTFTTLPDERTFEASFGFDGMYEEFHEGRPFADFALTDADLAAIGVDAGIRARTIQAISSRNESHLFAKIFDIGDIIRQKKQADPHHANELTTKEVLEAVDAAGYRPATFSELLAFNRDWWEPDPDPDGPIDEKEDRLRVVTIRRVNALGSPFSSRQGHRFIQALTLHRSEHWLNGSSFSRDWDSGDGFLVVRKELS